MQKKIVQIFFIQVKKGSIRQSSFFENDLMN